MKHKNRVAIILFSMGFYSLAFFLTQLFHEFGHAIIGMYVGSKPIMHTAYVEHSQDVNRFFTFLEKAAGPAFSLVQGLLFLAVLRFAKKPKSLLLFTWLSYHGLINTIGYFFIGSFVKGGDIGEIWRIYSLPTWLQILISIIAFSGFFFLPLLYRRSFATLSHEPFTNDEDAEKWGKTIGFFPGLIATPFIALVSLPLPHIATLIYIASAFLPLFMLPGAMPSAKASWSRQKLGRISVIGAVTSIITYLIINGIGRWIFDAGIQF